MKLQRSQEVHHEIVQRQLELKEEYLNDIYTTRAKKENY